MPAIFAAMTTLNFIIWNASPEIFSLPIKFWFIDTTLTLRWYGLFFALGFLISQQILYYMFKKEGKPEKDVDTLTIYMVIATIIGARLGHVFFYGDEQFGPLWYLQHPIEILKVWEGGLASHGGAIGILIALWIYSRKKVKIMSNDGKSVIKVERRPNQNYFQTLDRIVILVALTGALIRFGNVMNSEIIGKPTETDYGVVFARNVTDALLKDDNIQDVQYVKDDSTEAIAGYQAIKILVEFKPNPVNTSDVFAEHVESSIDGILTRHPRVTEHIYQPGPLDYTLSQDESGTYFAIIKTNAIPRHPAQLYESIACVLLFAFLLWLWFKYKLNLPEGRLFGIFLIVCFGLRIVWEFMKINQVDFENDLPLNMGQILSIPLVLLGIFMVIRSYRTNLK
jgi:phosphatidylglycerol---prolipoprotein diacylglyceryl transferase